MQKALNGPGIINSYKRTKLNRVYVSTKDKVYSEMSSSFTDGLFVVVAVVGKTPVILHNYL
jgi:hypothetical protein